MAKKRIWVHGSADALGEEELQSLKDSAFLSLITNNEIKNEWQVLTHKNGDSNLGGVSEAYSSDRFKSILKNLKKKYLIARSFFGQVIGNMRHTLEEFPEIKNKTHCTGLGKH